MALTAERVRQMFFYSVVSGKLYWRVNKGRAEAGNRAGHSNGGEHGIRLRVALDRKSYLVSRIVWLYVTGEWPVHEVDHVDTDPLNNAWLNLRDVTGKINMQNKRTARADSKSGFLGVGFKTDGAIRARITVNGKQKYLGTFETPEAAHEAYLAAKRELHEGNTL